MENSETSRLYSNPFINRRNWYLLKRPLGERIVVVITNLKKLRIHIGTIKHKALIWYAIYWQHFYTIKNRLTATIIRYKKIAILLIFLGLLILNCFIYPKINEIVEPYFQIRDRINGIQTLLITLGGAMIGATAIAFSLIMFAMQVNVGRVPYGLFRKFSSDLRLLSIFVIVFFLAIMIACLSLVSDTTWISIIILIATWSTIFIILFFLVAYKRALTLISPIEQLSILITSTKKNLDLWKKAARRATPLLQNNSEKKEADILGETHDMAKVQYFRTYPQWANQALQAIQYCISITRYHAVQGDYEISQAALDSIVLINTIYIEAKEKTFFINNPFFNNPLSHDSFISNTLEHFRKNVQIAISRGDEQQLEQTFNGLEKLCYIYLKIDYSTKDIIKTHTNLAVGYLASAIESTLPHKMADVIMSGICSLGRVACCLPNYGDSNDIVPISDKISLFSAAVASDPKLRPVTITGIRQLAELTLILIRSQAKRLEYPLNQIAKDIKFVAEIVLKIPDHLSLNIHCSTLEPYYSVTSTDSLLPVLTRLSNAVLNSTPDNEDAQRILEHVVQWGDDLYQAQKDLFLLALDKKSHFVFDIINWIVQITEIFLALSNADCCHDYCQTELRKNARWLICVLSCAPDNEEAIKSLENYHMTDLLFGAAASANQRGCTEISIKIQNILLSWMSKSVKYSIGQTIFEKGCYGLACLNIILNIDNIGLIADIQKILDQANSLSSEAREKVAQSIKRTMKQRHYREYSLSKMESALQAVDQNQLHIILTAITNCLSPLPT
jgi:hypothetical protein